MVLMVIGIILTVNPGYPQKRDLSGGGLCVIIFGTWIDKGLGMISGGFVPQPAARGQRIRSHLPEIGITLGVYAIGALVLTVLYKMAVGVNVVATRCTVAWPPF
jgi:hypothetical protein